MRACPCPGKRRAPVAAGPQGRMRTMLAVLGPAPASVPQVLLPGQAAAPEGPVDMIMMYVMHHAFRRDLAAFAARVPSVAVEDVDLTVRAYRSLIRRFVGA